MANKDLVNYVREQLKAGFDPDSIREHLIGYGYPVREIDEALDFATKPKAEAKPFHPAITKEEKKPVEETVKLIDMLKFWFISLILPMRVFEDRKKHASFTGGLMNVLLGGVLGGVIAGVIYLVMELVNPVPSDAIVSYFGLGGTTIGYMSAVSALTIFPIVAVLLWLSFNSLFYFFALVAGGNGSLKEQLYFASFYTAPITLFLSIFWAVPSKCVLFFIVLVFGIISIYPTLFSIKYAHNLSFSMTIIATVIPLALVTVFLIPGMLTLKSTLSLICS